MLNWCPVDVCLSKQDSDVRDYFEWNSSKHNLQLQEPSGGADNGGDKQYMW